MLRSVKNVSIELLQADHEVAARELRGEGEDDPVVLLLGPEAECELSEGRLPDPPKDDRVPAAPLGQERGLQ